MKKLFLLSFLFSMTFFLSCEKDDVANELTNTVSEEPQIDDTTDDDNTNSLSLNQYDGMGLTDVPESLATASFLIENQNGTVTEELQLVIENTSTNAVSYKWDFGNGDTAEGASPEYAFPYHGFYTVTLTVTDEKGMESSASQDLMVLCIFGGGDHDY